MIEKFSELADGRSGTLPVDGKAMANLILDWAEQDGLPISPMKLQKVVFFCHAEYILQYGQPLVKQEFEAWDYGPVIPSIYSEFKAAGRGNISKRAEIFNPILAKKVRAYCDLSEEDTRNIYNFYLFYSKVSAEELSDISHAQGGPWRHARAMFANGLNMDRRITVDMISRFHRVPHT